MWRAVGGTDWKGCCAEQRHPRVASTQGGYPDDDRGTAYSYNGWQEKQLLVFLGLPQGTPAERLPQPMFSRVLRLEGPDATADTNNDQP